MKAFEFSSKKRKDGKRRFTALLYKLQPPESVINNVGTDGHWNENGITFLEKYAVNNLDSIKDMSITCDFIDKGKTEVSGHGETGEITEDGLPKFEADIIGHFTEGFIDDFDDDGTTSRAVFGKGIIDEMRHADFVAQIETNMADGIAPSGSIEILHPTDSDSIVYLNGKFEQGRVPVRYVHSGFSLVSNPADKASKVVEFNNKKESEDETMDEKTISLICDSVKNAISETNSKNAEYEAIIAELNTSVSDKDQKITELAAQIEELNKTVSEINSERETWASEKADLEKQINDARAKEKMNELNSAIESFTDEQKAYAKDEIEAFKADPVNGEVNTITDKIYREIGKQSLETGKSVETNSVDGSVDIFGEINSVNANNDGEDVDIFASIL